MPEIKNWRWSGAGPGAVKPDTSSDNI
jgi:hypothetical protein